MKKALNVRHERFCELIASGESQTDAYLNAGFKTDRTNARKHAAALMTKHDISARIAELRKPQTKAALLKKEDNLRYLAAIIQTPLSEISPDSPLCAEYTEEVVVGGMRKKRKGSKLVSGYEDAGETVIRRRVKKQDPLRAIEIYSKLAGYFAPEQHVIETGPNTLASVEERAKTVRSSLNLSHGLTPHISHAPAPPAEEAQEVVENEPVSDLAIAKSSLAWNRWR